MGICQHSGAILGLLYIPFLIYWPIIRSFVEEKAFVLGFGGLRHFNKVCATKLFDIGDDDKKEAHTIKPIIPMQAHNPNFIRLVWGIQNVLAQWEKLQRMSKIVGWFREKKKKRVLFILNEKNKTNFRVKVKPPCICIER